MLQTFAKILARFPRIVLGCCFTLCLTLTIIAFMCTDMPDFSNPIMGFNTTGTEISNKLAALYNLQNEIGVGKAFYQFPAEVVENLDKKQDDFSNRTGTALKSSKKRKSKKKGKIQLSGRKSNKNRTSCENSAIKNGCSNQYEPGFCRINLNDQFAHLVFEVKDLSSWDAFEALCTVDSLLNAPSSNVRLVDRSLCHLHKRGSCCQSWHLASLAADILGKAHCSDLNRTDFDRFKELVNYCLRYKSLIRKCWGTENGQMTTEGERCNRNHLPLSCSSIDFYTIFEFLLSKHFLGFPENEGEIKTMTLMMLPVYKVDMPFLRTPSERARLLDSLEPELYLYSNRTLHLIAVDLGLKEDLFVEYLLRDTIFGVLAMFLVMAVTWLYTKSFLFTFFVTIGVFMSLGVAYFIYRILFIDFFPYVNLLTFVLMIGLGADDAFIYRNVWIRVKLMETVTVEKMVYITWTHALTVMFITSFTTAAAFFSNYISKILVLRCFGLFAGLTVVVNYVVAIIFVPAAVVALESQDCSWPLFDHPNFPNLPQFNILSNFYNTIRDWGSTFFEKLLPCFVIKLRFIWIIIFSITCFISSLVVFHYPGIRLPNRDYFQYFQSSHLLEQWDQRVSPEFAFSSSIEKSRAPLFIRVIWGIDPVLGSDDLERDEHELADNGSLNQWSNATFDLSDNTVLVWMREFCSRLATASFSAYEGGSMLPYCFVPDFMQWMNVPCLDASGGDKRPCCNENPFPYPEGVFDTCLERALSKFPNDIQRDVFATGFRNGPFLSRESGKFAILTIAFPSTYNFSLSYQIMDDFYTTVNTWVKDQLQNGPLPVRQGWFVNDLLQFYDLQKALRDGTRTAVLLSLTIAFIVLFVVTLNPLISLFSCLSVMSVIFTTVAILIGLQWELNVLESTIVILTIGLSFDFTLHYASAYQGIASVTKRMSYDSAALLTVSETLAQTGGPVFMAMLTTFLAGLAMMPTGTVAYFRVGLFMIIVTLSSWLHATFYFCSLLCLAESPCGIRCQLTWSGLADFLPWYRFGSRASHHNLYRRESRRSTGTVRHKSIITINEAELEPMNATGTPITGSCSTLNRVRMQKNHLSPDYARRSSKDVGANRRISLPVVKSKLST